MKYTVFSINRKHYNFASKESFWKKELAFFVGAREVEEIDFNKDAALMKIDGKRDQAEYLGIVSAEFPIKYPLTLDNGLTLLESEYKTEYAEEKDERT